MKIDNLTKEGIIIFLRAQWKPVTLGGIILLSLFITLLIPNKARNSLSNPTGNTLGRENNNSTNKPESKKQPFNPFGFLFDNNVKKGKLANEASSPLKNIPNGNTTVQIPSTIVKVQPNGTRIKQSINSTGTTQTAQGTIQQNSNLQTGVDSNVKADDIRIIFQNPDGTTFTYIPPSTPPGEVRWGRYSNTKSKYAINYPSNWQFLYSTDSNGFEGVALYPPGVDPNDANSPFIGFGMSASFLLPAASNIAGAYVTPLTVDGIHGSLYTNGSLGASYIASTLSYSSNYFGLGASKSDATFAYVYYYMLNSLTFNIE